MKLTEYQRPDLWHGTVFRFPAKHPFEPSVDFMLMDYPGSENWPIAEKGFLSAL